MKKILFWFYRQHQKEVVSILEAINKPPADIVPTRKLVLLPFLMDNKKLTSEAEYDQLIHYLENAGYVSLGSSGTIALTEDGKKLLKKYQEFWLLRPMKIIENSLKENLTAIISLLALLISLVNLKIEFTPTNHRESNKNNPEKGVTITKQEYGLLEIINR